MFMEHADTRGPTLNQVDDKALVKAVLDGERTAYGKLYDRYAPLVRAICYDMVRDLAEAQDLAQDVFLRAYERLEQLRKPESFGPWVIGMARLRCHEWRRKRLRECRRLSALETDSAGTETAARHAENGQLLRLIGRLAENERLALHAFYLRSQSVEEARRVLGLSRSGFYRVLERARNRLRKQLHEDQENIQ